MYRNSMERQFGREKCSGTRKGTASSKHFAKTLKIKRSLAPTRALSVFDKINIMHNYENFETLNNVSKAFKSVIINLKFFWFY